MKCVVTGAAGFIGSHLCEELLRRGDRVIALDCFVPYYSRTLKDRNRLAFSSHSSCSFEVLDLRTDSLDDVLADAEVVFHLAAVPGLVRSWSDLDWYWSCNVLATERLLDTLRRNSGSLRRFIYASTSSVYGRFGSGDENLPTRPASPYGVTKLAGENLCRAYGEAFGIPIVTLRYFSVYGPRQRPDMGYHRFIDALLQDRPVVVYGDGLQVRGNTYVSDCVQATLASVEAQPGEIYNVGGGETASVWDILRRLEALAGRKARVQQQSPRPGDQRYTMADTHKLYSHFGWKPQVTLDEGLARQWQWQQKESSSAMLAGASALPELGDREATDSSAPSLADVAPTAR
jgi:nucleoside-diphosphate-sugar epimerase